jgi:hypothetical protein
LIGYRRPSPKFKFNFDFLAKLAGGLEYYGFGWIGRGVLSSVATESVIARLTGCTP